MFKKLKASSYSSKADFQADLDLIHDNCYRYNTTEGSPYRMHIRELRERWVVLMRTVPDIIVRAKEEIDDAIILEHQHDEEGVDVRAGVSFYEATGLLPPRRHAWLMGRLYSHPEFEAFYNSVPDSHAFPTPSRYTREWTSEHLAQCIALIRDIQRMSASPIAAVASPLMDNMEDDSAIWIESPIDSPLNARRLAQRLLILLVASKGVKHIHRSALYILTDVFVEQMRSTLVALCRLIDEHALHMGLEVRGQMSLFLTGNAKEADRRKAQQRFIVAQVLVPKRTLRAKLARPPQLGYSHGATPSTAAAQAFI